MKWKKRVVATAACFILAGAAFAADAPKPTGMRGDVDGNGTLTAKELVEERANFFAAIDGDKDGKIRIEEFILALKKDFEIRDIDRNGSLSADEFVVSWCGKPAAPQAAKAKVTKPAAPVKGNLLKQMDKSGNGQIEPEECVQFWITRFGELDANSDGKVSQDEFIAAMKQAAERIDTNKDSFISIDEYKWYWADVPQAAKKAAPLAVK